MESNDKLEKLLRQMYTLESLHDNDIDTSDIVDEAWTKFEAEHFGDGKRSVKTERFSFLKIAAIFVGVLLLSGITYAAVQMINSSSQKLQKEQVVATVNTEHSAGNAQLTEQDSTLHKPIVYEDAELATILKDMASYYQVELVYKNEASKHIRLYFSRDQKQTIDDLVDTFNKFERIRIVYENKKLIVE